MSTLLYIVAKLVEITLGLVSFAMILRMLLPFFIRDENNKIYVFCCFVSEPFVIPFRYLLSKLNVAQNTPLDIPFMLAYLVIALMRMLLPII